MSRSRRKRERPTKVMRIEAEIEHQLRERDYFLEVCRTTTDPNKKHVCWCRAQEATDLIRKYRHQLRKFGHRLDPAPAAPLFKFNNKEI